MSISKTEALLTIELLDTIQVSCLYIERYRKYSTDLK